MENKVTGLFFSSDVAPSRENSCKTAVFPGSSDQWCGFPPYSTQTPLVGRDQPSPAGLLPDQNPPSERSAGAGFGLGGHGKERGGKAEGLTAKR